MEEIESMRIRIGDDYNSDIKLTVYKVNNNKRTIKTNKPNLYNDEDFGFSYRDKPNSYIIDQYLSNSGILSYEIIQNPWSEITPKPRSFGFDPYYLNNGSTVYIKWFNGDKTVGGHSWSDYKGDELDKPTPVKTTTTHVSFGTSAIESKKSLFDKYARIYGGDKLEPLNLNELGEIVPLSEFGINGEPFNGRGKNDLFTIQAIIKSWKSQIGGDEYELKLCDPSDKYCKIIEYKSPLKEQDEKPPTPIPASSSSSKANSPTKLRLNLSGIEDGFTIKAKEDIETFFIYIGELPKPKLDEYDDLQELDDIYSESQYDGIEESELGFDEIDAIYDNTEDSPISTSYSPDSFTGELVNLPEKFSHTKKQGFNILNSKWIGNLVTSAKSHLKTPTFDISDTESGALGCAAGVSIIFYRAFGVHMQTGEPVMDSPNSIGKFGSKGTGTLAAWFKNKLLYLEIPLEKGLPGDIVNTSRNGTTGAAGHVGIIIDTKHSNGSWNIISNSSKGFAGGGGGAIKLNYDITSWIKSVKSRNPSQTFAYRYVGPKL